MTIITESSDFFLHGLFSSLNGPFQLMEKTRIQISEICDIGIIFFAKNN